MSIFPVSKKLFIVFGLARSGLATVKWLLQNEAEVFVFDNSMGKQQEAISLGAKLWTPHIGWNNITALIQSPGISLSHPMTNRAREHFIPIIGDCDLFRMAHKKATIIGITGTNGKSTTTTLIHHILLHADIPSSIGGNIGVPVLSLPELPENGIYVLELSSYQIELSHELGLNYIGWLNITPDHLDRHGHMAEYVKTKAKIFDNMAQSAQIMISIDDEWSQHIYQKLSVNHANQVTPITCLNLSKQNKENAIFVHDKILYEAIDGKTQKIVNLSRFGRLSGIHNHQNIAISYGLCRKMGISQEKIIEAIETFPGLAHRQEWIDEIDNVIFINDSKGTNAEATAKALDTFEHIFWIAGGQPKTNGIKELIPYFNKIDHVFLIGAAQEEFARTIGDQIPYNKSGDLKTAVEQAYTLAKKINQEHQKNLPQKIVVLLSPACASFDQFKDFEERGDVFRQIVHTLKENN